MGGFHDLDAKCGAMQQVDPGHGRSLLTAHFMALLGTAFCFFFAYGMTVPVLPPFIKNQLGGTDLTVGIVIGIMAMSAICIRPLLAQRILEWGCPRVVLIAAVAGSVAFGLYGLSRNSAQLCALRLVSGASQASLLIGAITLVTGEVPPARRGQAISYFSVAPYLGIGIGPVLGQIIYIHLGYRWCFGVAGAIAMTGTVAVFRLPNVRIPRDRTLRRAQLIQREALWPGGVLAFGIVGTVAMSAFIPLFMATLRAGGSQWVFLSYAGIVLAVRVFGGTLPDRLGSSRTGVLATALIVAGMTGFAVTPDVVGIYLSLVPLGVGIALQYPGLLALTINRVAEDDRPRAVSTFTMFFDVSTGLGGLLVGAMASIGGYRTAFGGCAMAALVGVVCLKLFVLTRPERVPHHGKATLPIAGQQALEADAV